MEKSTLCREILSMFLFITTGYLRHSFTGRTRFAEIYKYLITQNTLSTFQYSVTSQVSSAFQFFPIKFCKSFYISIISSPCRIQKTYNISLSSLSSEGSARRQPSPQNSWTLKQVAVIQHWYPKVAGGNKKSICLCPAEPNFKLGCSRQRYNSSFCLTWNMH